MQGGTEADARVRSALGRLRDSASVAALAIDDLADDAASSLEAVEACAMRPAGHAVAAELRARFGALAEKAEGHGDWTPTLARVLSMYRRLRRAHVLMAASPCAHRYELVVRARPDLLWHAPLPWDQLASSVASGASNSSRVTILLPPSIAKAPRSRVPADRRCWAFDHAAAGSVEAMGAYSSLYADFGASSLSLLLHRADAFGHYAERILLTQLRWCGVTVDEAAASYSISSARHRTALDRSSSLRVRPPTPRHNLNLTS